VKANLSPDFGKQALHVQRKSLASATAGSYERNIAMRNTTQSAVDINDLGPELTDNELSEVNGGRVIRVFYPNGDVDIYIVP